MILDKIINEIYFMILNKIINVCIFYHIAIF